jgi:hypothetical protein
MKDGIEMMEEAQYILLTRCTGTRPSCAALMIWSAREFARSSSGGMVCRVAARVRKAFTSENYVHIKQNPNNDS